MIEKTTLVLNEESGSWTRTKRQTLNAALRLVTLFAKLALTLYMGRYLSLTDMGEYGLVFGAVMMLAVLLGQKSEYVVSREIVGANPVTALHRMRDQALLYLVNCLILALIFLVLIVAQLTQTGTKGLIFIFILAMMDGYAGLMSENLNALNRQLMANMLFFLRAGLWVLPVVVLGVVNPSFRTVDVVLTGWVAGVMFSYFVVAWLWRDMPWREAMKLPVDWAWLWRGMKKTSLIWLGVIGFAGGLYIDRFIVLHFLGLKEVGVITFYASFNNAMLALLQSGVSAFAYPRLIVFHREGKKDHFRKEARRTGAQVALSSAFIALGLGVAVPLLGHYSGHREYVFYASVFWLMLAGTWIRANAETLYLVLYTRQQDRPVWLGNLLFLAPAFGCNALLVPIIGLEGIGYGTIAAAAFLFVWRAWYVFRPSFSGLKKIIRNR